MPIVGCYTLDLYCDNYHDFDGIHEYQSFPHTFVGQTKGETVRKARKNGWIINEREDRAICPICSGKRRMKP